MEQGTRAQHIAFSTGDITDTARRIRAAGTDLLPVPANYYDDLDARFEFSPGELDTYRDLGILHDRDEQGGEFRHFYTVTVGRICFEVVQRTGGYGAADAGIRLAAQRDQRRQEVRRKSRAANGGGARVYPVPRPVRR